MKRLQTIASLAAAGALLVVPAIGQAHKGLSGKHNHGKAIGKLNKCVVKKGFVVKGTLLTYNAGTSVEGDETVQIDVTKMNKHASRSGISDPYTVTGAGTGGDSFKVKLAGYEPGEVPATGPSPGDKVRIIGKVDVTKRKCEPSTPIEDRYDAVDVRKVQIIDAD